MLPERCHCTGRSIARLALIAGALFAIAFSPGMQAQESAPRFEVTSVRPNKSAASRYDITSQANRFIARNVSLAVLLQWAYQVEYFRVSGGPSWMKSDRFDIEGKPSVNVSMDQQRLMLQTLLADRFQLKLRKEKRELPVYELVAAKGGPTLKEGKCAGTPSPANPCGATSGGRGRLIGRAAPVEELANRLSGIFGRSVLDKTALTGRYDFDLTWTPDETTRQGPGDEDAGPADGPSIFTALGEQLGLKLSPTKGQVEFIVVDSAERPSEN